MAAASDLADVDLGAVKPIDDLQVAKGGLEVDHDALDGLAQHLGLQQLSDGVHVHFVIILCCYVTAVATVGLVRPAASSSSSALRGADGGADQGSCS